MDKKKIIIILGLLAIAGIGFYMYNKKKKSTEETSSEDTTETKEPAETETKTPESSQATTPAKKPLTTKKEKKKACGRRPVLKKKRAEWQKCVDAGGSAFEGDYDDFVGDFDDIQNFYMDFEGEVDNQFMFSEFENNLDLDL